MVSGITSVKGASGAIKADTAQRSSLAKFGKQTSYGGLYCAFTYPPSGFNQVAKPFNQLQVLFNP